jgi:hypothetical protein
MLSVAAVEFVPDTARKAMPALDGQLRVDSKNAASTAEWIAALTPPPRLLP